MRSCAGKLTLEMFFVSIDMDERLSEPSDWTT
jgi:hypothetical protein